MHIRHPKILLVGVLGGIWAFLGAIGTLRTAHDIFENRGLIVDRAGDIVFSPWFGAGIALICVVLMSYWEWPFTRRANDVARPTQQAQIRELVDLTKFATDTLLNADLSASQTTWSYTSWHDRTTQWKQDVLNALTQAGVTEQDKSYFETLVTHTQRHLPGVSVQHAKQREILAENIYRLRNILGRIGSDQEPVGERSADQHQSSVKVLEWRDGDQSDTRAEYRQWSHAVFIIDGKKKERGRAYIEIDREPNPDRKPGCIGDHTGWSDEVEGLRPGAQYNVPVFMKLDRPVESWIDRQRRPIALSRYRRPERPVYLKAGCYVTDVPFLNRLHRQPLSSGEYRLRVVLILGDVKHQVEYYTPWRQFSVP